MTPLPERSPGGSSSSTRRRLAAYQSLPDGDSRARRERKGAPSSSGRLRRKCSGTFLRVKRTLRSGSKKKRKQQTNNHWFIFVCFFCSFFFFLPFRGVNSTRDEGSSLGNADRKLDSHVATQGYAGHSAKGIKVSDSFAILS